MMPGRMLHGFGNVIVIGTENGFGLVAVQPELAGKPVACHSPLTTVLMVPTPAKGFTFTSIKTALATLAPPTKLVVIADEVGGSRFTTTMQGSPTEGTIPISNT